jgi:hypothetical protein
MTLLELFKQHALGSNIRQHLERDERVVRFRPTYVHAADGHTGQQETPRDSDSSTVCIRHSSGHLDQTVQRAASTAAGKCV